MCWPGSIKTTAFAHPSNLHGGHNTCGGATVDTDVGRSFLCLAGRNSHQMNQNKNEKSFHRSKVIFHDGLRTGQKEADVCKFLSK